MASDKILLVESNSRIIEMLVDAFVRKFNANITCVSTAEDALDVEMLEPHSIVVADTNLPGMDAITMTHRLCELAHRPIILMGDSPTTADVIDAMRCGAVDFFPKPFAVEQLLESMENELDSYREVRHMMQRHQKLRTLVRRVIRERRELNRRVELICKDLVGAHKKLVMRVLENENAVAATP